MKPSRKRLTILTLISLATLINYLDRSVMGVAKPLWWPNSIFRPR
jgi:ACS family D-galactonate transporter-like MFS transporter